MSGVEVLGLVLGGIPLLISAFEHFRDLRNAKDWIFKFEEKYGKSLNDVKDEQIMFELHMRKLLLPLVRADVLDADELHELMLNPGGKGWQEKEVEGALKTRLGNVYERYMEVLSELPGILHKLLMTLGFKLAGGTASFQSKLEVLLLNNLARTQYLQYLQAEKQRNSTARSRLKIEANVHFVARRLDIVTSRCSHNELLRELQGKIEKLDKFITRRDEVATLEQQNSVVIPRRAIKALIQHWKHADRVYGLINQRMPCTCRTSHCAHLWLQHQANQIFELKLLVLYCSPSAPLPGNHLWQPQGLQIRYFVPPVENTGRVIDISKDEAEPPPAPAVPSKGSPNRSSLRGVLSRNQKPKSSVKRVSHAIFHIPEPGHGSSPPNCTDSTPQPTIKKVRIDSSASSNALPTSVSLSEIHDLCKALATLGMGAVCIGLLTDQRLGQSYQVMSQPRQKIVASEITLWDVLQPQYRPRIPRSTRFHLALKISSSHLKLQSTPWARRQWEARDVQFPKLGSGRGQVLFEDPYISIDFKEDVSRTQEDAETDPRAMPRSFTALGIMLLELLFGEPLEEHEFWEHLPDKAKDHQLRHAVAAIWAGAIKQELPGEPGRLFFDAIDWCLNESPLTLEGDEWRKDLADRVVLPLEKCCEWMQVKIS